MVAARAFAAVCRTIRSRTGCQRPTLAPPSPVEDWSISEHVPVAAVKCQARLICWQLAKSGPGHVAIAPAVAVKLVGAGGFWRPSASAWALAWVSGWAYWVAVGVAVGVGVGVGVGVAVSWASAWASAADIDDDRVLAVGGRRGVGHRGDFTLAARGHGQRRDQGKESKQARAETSVAGSSQLPPQM